MAGASLSVRVAGLNFPRASSSAPRAIRGETVSVSAKARGRSLPGIIPWLQHTLLAGTIIEERDAVYDRMQSGQANLYQEIAIIDVSHPVCRVI